MNTIDVELGTDELTTPPELRTWPAARDLLDPATRVAPTDLDAALRLRAGLREKLGVPVGTAPDPQSLRQADEVLRALPVVFVLGADGHPGAFAPSPELPPVDRAMAQLAIAWAELVATGESTRLKRCAEHGCARVFWDVSKNRSRRWCSMRVCGNRTKARRYAAKHTPAPSPEAPTADHPGSTTSRRMRRVGSPVPARRASTTYVIEGVGAPRLQLPQPGRPATQRT